MAISDTDFNALNSNVLITNKSRLARLIGKNKFTDTEFREDTQHKLNTNPTQTQHKPNTKADTNLTQTQHKPNTNLTQIGQNNKEIQHKPNTEPNTKVDTNLTQTQHKPNTKIRFTELIGLQRDMLCFMYNDCKISRSTLTNFLTLDHISQCLKMKKGSIKTTIERLLRKGFLKKKEFKNGRSGWVKYEIPESVYHELLHIDMEHKPNTNLTQTQHKPNTEPNTEPNTTLSSSSSILKTTTTAIENFEQDLRLPSEWEEIDFTELHRKNIFFGKKHLIDFFPYINKYSAFEIQESLDGFLYDIENLHFHVKRGYLNFLCGIFRKGNLYTSAHYVSEAQKKMNEVIELAHKKKLEREAYYQHIQDEKFHQWLQTYDQEKIKNELPVCYLVAFEHRHKDALDWIKKNIYEKLVF